MKTEKKIVLFLIALAAAFNAYALGKQDTPNEKRPITIEYWYAFGDKVGANNERLVKEFNESQTEVIVKAEYQGAGYNDVHTKFRAAFAAKNPPAVTLNEITVMRNFAKDGLTQSLDSYIKADNFDMDDIIPGLLSNTSVDGSVYGMPFLRSTPLMYYNVSLFEKAGLGKQAPKTLDQTLEYARKLTKTGQLIGFVTPVTTWTYEAIVDSFGASLLSADETKAVYNSAQAMKAMQFYLKGINEGVFKITTGGDATGQSRLEFQNQRSAMTLGSTADLTYYLQVAKENGFELGVAFIPSGGSGAVPTGGANLVMTAGLSREHSAAAWKFIKFMISKEQTIKSSAATGYLPVRTSAVEDPAMKAVYAENPLFRIAVDQLATAVPRPMAKNFPQVNTKLLDALMTCILSPAKDPQPVMDAAVAEANIILAK